ncbi:MAG: response regulator [Pseudomonadota bacterium]
MFPKDTRFLIVDDTKTIRSLIKEMLHKTGFRSFTEAGDGNAALQLMKERADGHDSFQFIICDWNMPVMTGIELLEIRNQDQRFQSIPFLMVTIESEREYVLKAVSMGVSDFVVKPFSEATLASKIQGIWNRLQAE